MLSFPCRVMANKQLFKDGLALNLTMQLYDFLWSPRSVLCFQLSKAMNLTVLISSPADNYMFKVNNRNTRTRCEICSKLTIKTSERRHWRHSGVFIVNVGHISNFVLVFLLLTLSRWILAGRFQEHNKDSIKYLWLRFYSKNCKHKFKLLL